MQIDRHLLEMMQKSAKSVLLIGPRQTGKSTLIRQMRPDHEINLSDEDTYIRYLRDPALLPKAVRPNSTVFIDEVQRIPSLLNTAQSILDRDKSIRFLLTGSSARKLRRGQANLLPGRVLTYQLGPLTLAEIGPEADLRKLMMTGALPGVYTEPDSEIGKKILRSYSSTYLREEIQAEALTRNLEGFSRFFDTAAARSGEFMDFSKVSSLAMIERTSAKRYFDILVDTLVVNPVEAFAKSAKRRLIQHPKFYFFDVGVWNACVGNFEASPDRIGVVFEHLCLQMILSEAKARDEDIRVSFYRTEAGAEVDFIVERGRATVAVEVKATRTIGTGDLRGLKSFAEFRGKKTKSVLLYLGEQALDYDGVQVLPLAQGLEAIFE